MSRARVVAVLAALAGLAVGGCSSSDAPSPAAAASDEDLCSSADDLRASIADLGDVQVVQDGTEALRQAFSTVGDDVNRVADQARDDFSDDVSTVESAAGDVRTSLEGLGSAPSAAAVTDVRSAVQALVEDAGALVDEVESTC